MIVLKNPYFFKRAVMAISSFIREGNFRFSSDGLFFKAIDQSQILLVDFFIDKKYFDEYDIEPTIAGMDLQEFNKILQRSSEGDKLSIELNDAEAKIKLESDLKRSFRLPLIDIFQEEIKLPTIDYESTISIDAASLKEILKDAVLFGGSIMIKIQKGRLFFEARGSQGSMDSEVPVKIASVVSKKDVSAKFSLGFFQNIVREADAGKIQIFLKEDSPMKVSYSFGQSKISFYLAHMII